MDKNVHRHPNTNGIKYHVLFLTSKNVWPTAVMPNKATKTALAAREGSYLKNSNAWVSDMVAESF